MVPYQIVIQNKSSKRIPLLSLCFMQIGPVQILTLCVDQLHCLMSSRVHVQPTYRLFGDCLLHILDLHAKLRQQRRKRGEALQESYSTRVNVRSVAPAESKSLSMPSKHPFFSQKKVKTAPFLVYHHTSSFTQRILTGAHVTRIWKACERLFRPRPISKLQTSSDAFSPC